MVVTTGFQTGDRVRHPRKPEWGTGTVRLVQAIEHEGKPVQRVTVDFAGRGRVVLNTGIAPLELQQPSPRTPPPDERQIAAARHSVFTGPSSRDGGFDGKDPSREEAMSSTLTATGPRKNWLDELEKSSGGVKHELWELPDKLRDPFATPVDRLRATLETYRFSTEPRALLDWGRVQTGLDDPLTKYTRQELEQAFPRFARDRDAHLRTIVRDLKRKGDQASIKGAQKGGLFPAAQSALDKALRS